LQGHGHWVNTLALSSDYIIRTGAFDPKDATLVREENELPSNMKVEIGFNRFYNTLKSFLKELN
jgi:hypothetical protein